MLPGRTTSSLAVNNCQLTNNGWQYSVVVTNVYGAVTGGPVTLTVGEFDTNPPTVAITSPANNAEFTTNVITVSGTAKDAYSGVNSVQVRVNGGAWQPATLGGTPAARTWNIAVTLTLASPTRWRPRPLTPKPTCPPNASRNYLWAVPLPLVVNIAPAGRWHADAQLQWLHFSCWAAPTLGWPRPITGYLFINW